MPIVAPEVITERGKADARRHREKQKNLIKKQLPKIIAEESIITGKKGKMVKIPIRGLQIPEFKHKRGGSGGIGQGKGAEGDILGKRPGGKDRKPGKAGSEPGVDYIETEMELEELIEMMLEDLGLPLLQEKNVRKLVVELGWRIHGTANTGPQVLLDRQKTAREGMKRFWHSLEALHKETGASKPTCYEALKKTSGNMPAALEILKSPDIKSAPEDTAITPFIILDSSDLRYHRIQKKVIRKSQAVVFALMDVSGSMTTEKKYFARSLLFWLTAFLRKVYEYVDIRFIIHHATARAVDEDEFFHTGESGGTVCATAYELTNSLISAGYPPSEWNIYVCHFSDGEDFDTNRSVEELRKLFTLGINMFGYGEIQPKDGASSFPVLLQAFAKEFELKDCTEEDSFKVVASESGKYPFVGAIIQEKKDILSALRAFLRRDRWQK